jgi:hypothetical protein
VRAGRRRRTAPAGPVDGRLAGRGGTAAFGVVTRATLLPAALAAVVVGPGRRPGRTGRRSRPSCPGRSAPGRRTARRWPSGTSPCNKRPRAWSGAGLALGGVGPLVPGRCLAGPDRVGLAAGDPERHRPARLDLRPGPAATGWRRCRAISLLRLAWPRAAPPGSGRPVVRREAAASPAGVSCLEGQRVDGIDGLASDDLCCVCRFPARAGSDPRWWSASHLADDRTASVTR